MMKEILYIMENTVYTFGEELEFFREVRLHGLSNREAYKLLLHEKKHLEMARSLGHEAHYGIRSDRMNRWTPITFLPNREKISHEDIIKISLAPVVPSHDDQCRAEMSKEKIREEQKWTQT